jgi:hypothetical protein
MRARFFGLFRARTPWSSPERSVATLLAFAETEADGARDLDSASRRIADPILRAHVQRHAVDEARHAQLLRQRAAELSGGVTAGAGSAGDSRYDLEGAARRGRVQSHGFYSAGLYDQLGEVAYVAMLHVAECRALELFARQQRAAADDRATAELFGAIVVDEKYHVAYTARMLEGWRASGRGREVSEGLERARTSRWIGAWKRVGLRSAGGFGRLLLYVLYFVALWPFGLLARRLRFDGSLRAPRPTSPESQA